VGDLGGVSDLSWVVTAYLLSSTVAGPVYGKLGDQYGRKLVLQTAIVIFLIGSSRGALAAVRAARGAGRSRSRPTRALAAGPPGRACAIDEGRELLHGWDPDEHPPLRQLIDKLGRDLVSEIPAPLAAPG
jgi:hypothetical protein